MENTMPKAIREIVLTRIRFNKRYNLSYSGLISKGTDVHVEVSKAADSILIDLGKEVYGRKAVTSVSCSFKHPKNWFEHLKKSLGIKYAEEEFVSSTNVDVYALFPELRGTNPTVVIKSK